MRAVRMFALLVVVGLLGAACARLTGTSSQSGASTVTVTTKDSGRTIALHVGDHLVLDLGPSFAGRQNGLLRTTLRFPIDLLSLVQSTRKLGYWELTAKATGTGKVMVVSAPCGPLLAPAPAAGVPCPVAGGAEGTPSPAAGEAGIPARLFTVAVRIT